MTAAADSADMLSMLAPDLMAQAEWKKLTRHGCQLRTSQTHHLALPRLSGTAKSQPGVVFVIVEQSVI